MKKIFIPLLAGALSLGVSFPLQAHEVNTAFAKAPPQEPYKAVSSLVKLPDFIPGIGQLFVDPSTLPAGPFLAYDRDGQLVSTIYMIPVKDFAPEKSFNDLKVPFGKVDHTDIMYNAGHPGVEVPHVHIVLWHIPADQESRVAK